MRRMITTTNMRAMMGTMKDLRRIARAFAPAFLWSRATYQAQLFDYGGGVTIAVRMQIMVNRTTIGKEKEFVKRTNFNKRRAQT